MILQKYKLKVEELLNNSYHKKSIYVWSAISAFINN